MVNIIPTNFSCDIRAQNTGVNRSVFCSIGFGKLNHSCIISYDVTRTPRRNAFVVLWFVFICPTAFVWTKELNATYKREKLTSMSWRTQDKNNLLRVSCVPLEKTKNCLKLFLIKCTVKWLFDMMIISGSLSILQVHERRAVLTI
jgi:hypothetical protein